MKVDWLTITFPDESMRPPVKAQQRSKGASRSDYSPELTPALSGGNLRADLLDIIFAAGAVSTAAYVNTDGVKAKGKSVGQESFKLGATGRVRLTEMQGYHIVTMSGAAIDELRAFGVFDTYLSCVAGVPHKVTKLDIAHDVKKHAPTVIDLLYAKAKSEDGIKLSRKRCSRSRIVRESWYSDEDTGSLMLGKRTSEVHAVIYDKRNEILDHPGVRGNPEFDVGPLTRYEVKLSDKIGISLSDAAEPEAAFWHFMSQVLAPPKRYVDNWVPGGFSFKPEPREPGDPAAKLRRRVEGSADLESIIGIALETTNGLRLLDALIAEKIKHMSPKDTEDELEPA